MRIGVVYASPEHPLWLNLDVEEGCSVENAIQLSGILRYYPDIDLKQQKVGIFGKLAKLDAPVHDGDRIEIYRRITRVLDDDDDDDDD